MLPQNSIDRNEFKEIWAIVKNLFHHKTGVLIFSAILLIMLYGTHGDLELLKFILKDWSAPGVSTSTRTAIIPFIPWDREFISFSLGFVLLVLIPCIIIKFVFRESLSDYGICLPAKEHRRAAWLVFLLLILISVIPFYFASKDKQMQAVYPFFKLFTSKWEFAVYELTYLPFFITIEFIFRGFLLLGLVKVAKDDDFQIGAYAILVAMLSYTAWHLGKPVTELWGTPIWGLVAGASVYRVRSILPVVAAHWLLNIWLDALIFYQFI